LPVFQEVMLAVYRDKLVGPAPAFPAGIEERIAASVLTPAPPVAAVTDTAFAQLFNAPPRRRSPAEPTWFLQHGMTVQTPIAFPFPPLVPKKGVFWSP
jgi:hypothetical protein